MNNQRRQRLGRHCLQAAKLLSLGKWRDGIAAIRETCQICDAGDRSRIQRALMCPCGPLTLGLLAQV